jgi:hypothetical protein
MPVSPGPYKGTIDSTGFFSTTLINGDSSLLLPKGSQWLVQVCPDVGAGGGSVYPCTQITLPLSGTTVNLSSQLNAATGAISVGGLVPMATAYQDNEIATTSLRDGTFYFNTLSRDVRCWWQGGWYDCFGGGGGSNATYEHNGTFVGQQPILDFVDTPSVGFTLLNDSGNNRVTVQATASGGGGGSVSCENLSPLMYCNANYPSTTNDIIYNNYNWGQNTAYMGPPTGTQNLPYLVNSVTCQENPSSNAVCTFPSSLTTGDAFIFAVLADNGSVGTPTDTLGNTATCLTFCTGTQGVWYVKNTQGGNDTVTVPLGTNADWSMIMSEVVGADPTAPIQTSNTGGTCSSSNPYTLTFASVNLTSPGTVIALQSGGGIAGTGYGVYSAGAGYNLEAQSAFYGGSGLGNSRSQAIEWGPAVSAGMYSPTMIYTELPGASSICPSPNVTIAIKPASSSNADKPFPRYIKQTDLLFLQPNVYGLLTACSATTEGNIGVVNDSTTNTWGATVAGGGSLHVMVYCDGTNWTVMAK